MSSYTYMTLDGLAVMYSCIINRSKIPFFSILKLHTYYIIYLSHFTWMVGQPPDPLSNSMTRTFATNGMWGRLSVGPDVNFMWRSCWPATHVEIVQGSASDLSGSSLIKSHTRILLPRVDDFITFFFPSSISPHPPPSLYHLVHTVNMGFGGVLLRFCSLAIRVLQFLDGAVILGIFSYFLAILSQHHLHIATWLKAVEGLSGAATLYGLLGVVFVCCLGGVAFFAFLGVVLDVCFTGAMIAIAVLTRNGTDSCKGKVNTPLGSGEASDSSEAELNFGMACRLEKVTFAVAVIGV